MSKRVAAAIVILIVLIYSFVFVGQLSKAVTWECAESLVPHGSYVVDDNSYDKGVVFTSTTGKDGVEKICKNGYGEVVNHEVTTPPVSEVITHGTNVPEPVYEEEYVDEAPAYGSICNDGWHSPSVGRGACSWHGGVAY